jgi:hypothetical protein
VPGYPDPVPAIEWGDDFGSPHETYLAAQFEKPVFVHHYPTQVKAFYMEPEPGRPEVCRSVDLLAPEGYGEIIGGSERMSDAGKLLAAIDASQTAAGDLRVVPRPAPLRLGGAQRLWPGRGAHRGLGLRPGSRARDHRLPAHADEHAPLINC